MKKSDCLDKSGHCKEENYVMCVSVNIYIPVPVKETIFASVSY